MQKTHTHNVTYFRHNFVVKITCVKWHSDIVLNTQNVLHISIYGFDWIGCFFGKASMSNCFCLSRLINLITFIRYNKMYLLISVSWDKIKRKSVMHRPVLILDKHQSWIETDHNRSSQFWFRRKLAKLWKGLP